jgi:hypothetical protein
MVLAAALDIAATPAEGFTTEHPLDRSGSAPADGRPRAQSWGIALWLFWGWVINQYLPQRALPPAILGEHLMSLKSIN